MDYTQFAASIKQKYPQYKDVDDFELSQKMIEKYPEYKGKVSFNHEQPVTPTPQPEQGGFTNALNNFAVGVAKTELGLVKGASKLATSVGAGILSLPAALPGGDSFKESFDKKQARTTERMNDTFLGDMFSKENLTPKNTGEKVGAFVGDVATYAIPGTAIAKGAKAASQVASTGKTLSRTRGLTAAAATEAAGFGAVETLKQGEINKEVATTAALSGAFPIASAALKKVASNVKTAFSTASIGKDAVNILKKYSTNPSIKRAVEGKITNSSIADSFVSKIQDLQKAGQTKMGIARRLLTKDEVIPSNSVVKKAHDTIRSHLNIADGEKITAQLLQSKALSQLESSKIMKALDDLHLKAGKPVTKISPTRLDEIIGKIDKIGIHDKTDDGANLMKVMRRDINEMLPTSFKDSKKSASSQIRSMEKDVRDILGINIKKLQNNDLLNADQIADKVSAIVRGFNDKNKKANTIAALKVFDAKYKTSFADDIGALAGANDFEKALTKNSTLMKELKLDSPVVGAVAVGGATAMAEFIPGNPIVTGVSAGVMLAALKSPKARQKVIEWYLKTPSEIKEQSFTSSPALKSVIRAIMLETTNELE